MTKATKKGKQKVTPKRKPQVRRLTYNALVKAIKGSYGNVSYIAQELECERKTVYEWLEKSDSLTELLQSERERIVDLAEAKMVQSINAGSDGMTTFVLKTLGKERGYVEKQQIEHSGTTEQRIRNMSQSERDERAKQLLKELQEEFGE